MVLLAGFAIGAAACGGSASPGVAKFGSTTTSTSGPSTGAGSSGNSGSAPATMTALLKLTGCMQSHAIPNFPDPSPGGGYSRGALNAVDPNSPQYQAALKACRSDEIAAGWIHTAAQDAQHDRQLLAYAECMRKNGVTNFPDPVNGGFSVPAGSSGFDVTSPAFQKADKTCAHLNP